MQQLTQKQLDSAIALICEFKSNMQGHNGLAPEGCYAGIYVKHPELHSIPAFAEMAALSGGPTQYEVAECLHGISLNGLKLTAPEWHNGPLHGLSFARCSFRMSDMTLCEFRECYFAQCDFDGASMEGVIFTNSPVIGCSMRRCDLTHATFEMVEPDWPNAGDIPSVDFNGVDLSMANLRGATFSNFELSMVDFSLCNLAGVKFDEATISRSDVRRADFSKQHSMSDVVMEECYA